MWTAPCQVDSGNNKNLELSRFCRHNEGKSIKEEDLTKIFDRFYRTDEARNSQTGGSGLGLSIAKSIVNLHKGKRWGESKGNKVYFYVLIKLDLE